LRRDQRCDVRDGQLGAEAETLSFLSSDVFALSNCLRQVSRGSNVVVECGGQRLSIQFVFKVRCTLAQFKNISELLLHCAFGEPWRHSKKLTEKILLSGRGAAELGKWSAI
jgi:hypothetical protein